MAEKILHPGTILGGLMGEGNLSQRELASRLDIAHSLLNNILNGNRAINIKLAISLQAIGFKDANFWLTKQMQYDLYVAQNDPELIKKQEEITNWNEIEKIVPVSYFKKFDLLNSDYDENINSLYKIYQADDIYTLKHNINNYAFNNFRKSSKFTENAHNVIAWSYLAEYKASLEEKNINPFIIEDGSILINELNNFFFNFKKGENYVERTKKILNKHGILFLILDRPSQTPVDGKCFMSGDNPAIVLSLKYNRLDNFAFNLMHELGHIYTHLSRPKYKNASFFTNAPNIEKEEFEADNFARNSLIDIKEWNKFISTNDDFNDECILDFSKKIKVHPGIIRGRVCFEMPEYYAKRTIIRSMNTLED